MFRTNWQDFEAWSSSGLAISSTASVEAVKMYDAVVSQFIGWYDEPSVDGMMGAMKRMHDADPNFLLGNAFALSMSMSPGSYFDNGPLTAKIDDLERTAKKLKDSLTDREYRHALATVASAKMDWSTATGHWEAILADHPNDVHALKMAFFTHFYVGQRKELYDMVERSYKAQERSGRYQSSVHFPLMHAYYGFTLQEQDRFKEAEVYAKKGLEADDRDGWATHTMAHICEMSGRFDEGLNFLTSRNDLWTRANHLAGHNYWHQSLFNVALGDFDGALDIFDTHLEPNAKAIYGISDASSLLQRLLFIHPENRTFKAEDIEKRFKGVFEGGARDHLDAHDLGYTDAHLLMAALGSGNNLEATELVESLATSKLSELHPQLAVLTRKLFSAITDFSREQYEKATDTMNSIRREYCNIGGSNAQRDVFCQLHLVSAVRSTRAEHKDLLKELMEEREALAEGDKWRLRKVVVKEG